MRPERMNHPPLVALLLLLSLSACVSLEAQLDRASCSPAEKQTILTVYENLQSAEKALDDLKLSFDNLSQSEDEIILPQCAATIAAEKMIELESLRASFDQLGKDVQRFEKTGTSALQNGACGESARAYQLLDDRVQLFLRNGKRALGLVESLRALAGTECRLEADRSLPVTGAPWPG